MRFVSPDSGGGGGGSGIEGNIVVTKNRDELFHRVEEGDLPRGGGEVMVQV